MQPQSDTEYKQLLTDVIKKQIVILGPDITLVKARNVAGLKVNDDGTVIEITGQPEQITQSLIDQFVQLSGLIVKKTMEPLLAYHATPAPTTPQLPVTNTSPIPATPVTPSSTPVAPQPMPQPVQPVVSPTPTQVIPPTPIVPTPAPTVTPTQTPPLQQPESIQQSNIDSEVNASQIDTNTQKIIDEALKNQ